MLEKMDDFFNSRVNGYEEHQLNEIFSAKEFYDFTAKHLPMEKNVKILDLGCGTGLELGFYFELNQSAIITCIDMAAKMLAKLKEKFKDKNIEIIQGSYFDISFKKNYYNAALSVESLHHYTKEEKITLYKKIFQSLCKEGYFLLTDYFAISDEEEVFFRREFIKLKAKQKLCDDNRYHFDTPLTVEHEIEALKLANFTKIEILKNWGATYILKANKL